MRVFLRLVPLGLLAAFAVACSSAGAPAPVPVAPPAVSSSAVPETTAAPPPPTTTHAPATSTTRRTTTKTKTSTVATHSREACLRDETQCYEPGTNIKCSTGGCVNAARGLTDSDVRAQTQQWLRDHPGWCAFGETGAVGRC